MEDVSGVELPLQICVIGEDLIKDKGFLHICSKFGYPLHTSANAQCKLNWTTFWCLWAASKFFLNWIKPFEQQFEQLEEWWGVCFQAKNAKNDDFRETNSYCFSAAVMTA